MSNFRKILPLQSDATDHQKSAISGSTPLQTSKARKQRVRHSTTEWNAVKPLILGLYQSQKLEDVMKEVRRQTGFDAGVRQYKNMLAVWDALKYTTEGQRGFILGKCLKRKRDGKGSTEFLVRGVQLEDQTLNKLEARYSTGQAALQQLSPLVQVTPEDIEYYTPIGPNVHRKGIIATPEAFTPLTKLSRHAVDFKANMVEGDEVLPLLALDEITRQIRYVTARPGAPKGKQLRAQNRSGKQDAVQEEVRRETRDHRQKLLSEPLLLREPGDKVHDHVDGNFAAVGCGRFVKEQILHSILWKGYNLGIVARDYLEQCEHLRQGVKPAVSTLQEVSKQPEYSVVAVPAEFAPQSLSHLLELVKSSKLIHSILGLRKPDQVHWAGVWRPLGSHDTASLYQVTNHLLGDLVQAYPTYQMLSVYVSFASGDSNSKPLVLRVSMAQSTEERTSNCRTCSAFLFMIDFMGSSGACKLRVPLADQKPEKPISSLKAFREECDLFAESSFGVWSKTTAILDGVQMMKHYRRCYCGGAVHQKGFRKHYIDMQTEIESQNESWKPDPEDVEERVFDPFPLLGGLPPCLVENYDSTDEDSENEHWDPDGSENHVTEKFESHPSYGEPNLYVSKPCFLDIHL